MTKTPKEPKTPEKKQVEPTTAVAPKVADKTEESGLLTTARKIVNKAADTTQARADNAYASSNEFNNELESLMLRSVQDNVGLLNSFADRFHSRFDRGISNLREISQAQTVQDALKIHADFLSEQAGCDLEDAKSAVLSVRDGITSYNQMLRSSVSKVWNSGKAATA